MLGQIGRSLPSISGSTAALVAAHLGAAMARMALTVAHKHGSDTDLVVERLDSIVSQIKEATEKDTAASTALLNTYRQNSGEAVKRSALLDATREPLAAAHVLIEILELLEDASNKVADRVTSDFDGGVERIGAGYRAVMMAVESNLRVDGAEQLRSRMAFNRSSLRTRFDVATKSLRREGPS